MTTITITPSHFRVRPAPGASKSPSGDTMREALPTLDLATCNSIPSRYVERWENEGGTWLDEHSIAFNS